MLVFIRSELLFVSLVRFLFKTCIWFLCCFYKSKIRLFSKFLISFNFFDVSSFQSFVCFCSWSISKARFFLLGVFPFQSSDLFGVEKMLLAFLSQHLYLLMNQIFKIEIVNPSLSNPFTSCSATQNLPICDCIKRTCYDKFKLN